MHKIHGVTIVLVGLVLLSSCSINVPDAQQTPPPEIDVTVGFFAKEIAILQQAMQKSGVSFKSVALTTLTDETQRFQFNGDGYGSGGFVPKNSMLIAEHAFKALGIKTVDRKPSVIARVKEDLQLKNNKLVGDGTLYSNLPGEKGPVPYRPVFYGELSDYAVSFEGQFTNHELTKSKGGFVSVAGFGLGAKSAGAVITGDYKMSCSDTSTLATTAVRSYVIRREFLAEIGRFLPPKTTDVLVIAQYTAISGSSADVAERLNITAAVIEIVAEAIGFSFEDHPVFKPRPKLEKTPLEVCLEHRARLTSPPPIVQLPTIPPPPPAPAKPIIQEVTEAVRVPFDNHVRTIRKPEQRERIALAQRMIDGTEKDFEGKKLAGSCKPVEIVGFTCPDTEFGKLQYYRQERAIACGNALNLKTSVVRRGAEQHEQEKYNEFLRENPDIRPHAACIIRLLCPEEVQPSSEKGGV